MVNISFFDCDGRNHIKAKYARAFKNNEAISRNAIEMSKSY